MKRRKQAANEALGVLAEWFPNAFFLYERKRKPLKVGIQDDLITATAGAITVREIRDALCRYTGNVHYLRGVAAGGERIDLRARLLVGELAPGLAHALGEKHAARLCLGRGAKQPRKAWIIAAKFGRTGEADRAVRVDRAIGAGRRKRDRPVRGRGRRTAMLVHQASSPGAFLMHYSAQIRKGTS